MIEGWQGWGEGGSLAVTHSSAVGSLRRVVKNPGDRLADKTRAKRIGGGAQNSVPHGTHLKRRLSGTVPVTKYRYM